MGSAFFLHSVQITYSLWQMLHLHPLQEEDVEASETVVVDAVEAVVAGLADVAVDAERRKRSNGNLSPSLDVWYVTARSRPLRRSTCSHSQSRSSRSLITSLVQA